MKEKNRRKSVIWKLDGREWGQPIFFRIFFETKSKKISVIWKHELFPGYFLKQTQRKSQLYGTIKSFQDILLKHQRKAVKRKQ